MFGERVLDEVTSNIIRSKGFPHAISLCIVVFIAIVPLTKIPLKSVNTRKDSFVSMLLLKKVSSARPIYNVIENLVGLDPQEIPRASGLLGLSGYTRGVLKFAIRIFTLAVIILLAILVPSFDTIVALSGSAMAFSICIILPLAFHLKLFGKELGTKEKVLNWFLIVVSSIMAVIGTVWVFLPKQMRERMDGLA